MKIIKRIAAILISITLGLVFVYSGYSKLLPVIETFEFSFVDSGFANWYTAPFMARLLIGLELFTGLLLILNYNLKKFTLPLTAILLLFFTLYLIIQIFVNGNVGDCGCFGEHIYMTPGNAIIKNVVMLVACFILYLLTNQWKFKLNNLFLSLVLITVSIIPFIINPIDLSYTSNNLEEKVNYPLELNLLYQPVDTHKVEVPKLELRNGKHILAFMSLTCPHCRIAAKKFRIIKNKNPLIPIYFILNGDKKDYPIFIEDTKSDNIPNSFCLGKTFIQLASTNLPRIYYLDNGIIVKKVDYFELNQYAIEDWLKTGKLK